MLKECYVPFRLNIGLLSTLVPSKMSSKLFIPKPIPIGTAKSFLFLLIVLLIPLLLRRAFVISISFSFMGEFVGFFNIESFFVFEEVVNKTLVKTLKRNNNTSHIIFRFSIVFQNLRHIHEI